MPAPDKPYIGARDFFPEDMVFRNWMFSVQRDVCVRYGYQEYGAPILEPVDLYRIKSSDEILNEQLYRFVDRGDREVAIRPEMTPTLARMVASRATAMPKPFRWFSIANFMRYERPGRGRLREFFQLNVDLMGAPSAAADAEILLIACDLMLAYGAKPSDFSVRFSDRRLFSKAFADLSSDVLRKVGRLMDKRDKMKPGEFAEEMKKEAGPDVLARVEKYLSLDVEGLAAFGADPEVVQVLGGIQSAFEKHPCRVSLQFDPGIVRGFDYYTGLIFEINDNDPENRRALFGGGRYDKLIGLFAKDDVPAVGFGMGDVTLENFLRTRGLVPTRLSEPQGCYIALFSDDLIAPARELADFLRAGGIPVEMSLEATKKFGKQMETAEKKKKRYVLILGADEIAKGIVRVKDLNTGEQKDVPRRELLELLR